MKEFADSLEGAPACTFDEVTLAPVRQLNAHALTIIADCASHPAWKGSAWDVALGPNFPRIPSELRAELARGPVSLVEFGISPSALAAPSIGYREPPTFLPLNKAVELSQITLTLAWTFCRQDIAAARIVFGLTTAEALTIRNLDVRDLPRIAERIAGQLRPRWLDRPRIWHELLRHSCGARTLRPALPYLRILQRQLADFRLATGATTPTRLSGP